MPDSKKLVGTAGQDLPGYLSAGDGGGGRPSIIVLHEWWGLNDQIRAVADRFAQEGLVAFAPDLYRGKVATDPATAQKYMGALDWSQAEADLRRAVQALNARDPKTRVGVTGFCMGGALALFAAAKIPALKACVPFYGIPDPSKADLTKIEAKLQGHFAQRDDWITPARVAQLEEQFARAGVPVEIHRYDAGHAFFNERRKDVYSPKDAQLAWERTLGFLKSALA